MCGCFNRGRPAAADIGNDCVLRFLHIRMRAIGDVSRHALGGDQTGPFSDKYTYYICAQKRTNYSCSIHAAVPDKKRSSNCYSLILKFLLDNRKKIGYVGGN